MAFLDYIAQEALIYRKEGNHITRDKVPAFKREPLRLELESFVECVRLGGKPQVPAEHGLEALKVATDIVREVEKSERKLRKLQEKSREEWIEEEY